MKEFLKSKKSTVFLSILFYAVAYTSARFFRPEMASFDGTFMAIFGMVTAVGTTLITGQSFIDHKSESNKNQEVAK